MTLICGPLRKIVDRYSLGIAPTTLLNWIRRGVVTVYAKPKTYLGRGYCFDHDALTMMGATALAEWKAERGLPLRGIKRGPFKTQMTKDERHEYLQAKFENETHADLSITDAAYYAGVSYPTLWRWLTFDMFDLGDVTPLANGKYRFLLSALDAMAHSTRGRQGLWQYGQRKEDGEKVARDFFGDDYDTVHPPKKPADVPPPISLLRLGEPDDFTLALAQKFLDNPHPNPEEIMRELNADPNLKKPRIIQEDPDQTQK
jgi:hypothetical protein